MDEFGTSVTSPKVLEGFAVIALEDDSNFFPFRMLGFGARVGRLTVFSDSTHFGMFYCFRALLGGGMPHLSFLMHFLYW